MTLIQEQLSDSVAQVLAQLISGSQLSRPELTSLLSITAPTVSAALAELVELGLVTEAGLRQGQLGRAARLYALDPGSGWLLGIDLGSTQIHIVARTLDGKLVSDFRHSININDEEARAPRARPLIELAFGQINKLMAELPPIYGELRAVGIALPHVVPNLTSAESMIGLGEESVRLGDVFRSIGLPESVPILLENNVNCAALAEMSLGVARSTPNFVYVQIGVRLGAGLVVDGKLRRGSGGGSGEIARLPFPMGPMHELKAQDFQLERYLGAAQLLGRLRDQWPDQDVPPPDTPERLFKLASEGCAPARAAVQEYAKDIAQIAMVLCAVVDPKLIVLGGGVGQNPILGRLVEEFLHREYPEVELDVSALGQGATVEGAVALATEYARTRLLGEHYLTMLSAHGQVVTV